jgi:hypothetical protein
MKNIKNFTPQPNAIFDLDLLPISKLIILYLYSKGRDWNIIKNEVRKHLHLTHPEINGAWKDLIRKQFLLVKKGFGSCSFVLNVDVINALMNDDNVIHNNVKHEYVNHVNVKHVNVKHESVSGVNTDVSVNTDRITTMDDIINTTEVNGVKRWILNNNVPTSSIIQQQFPELTEEQITTLRNEAVDESFYL